MIKLSTSEWTIDNIEYVLFDKDGTFIDLHYFWGKMTELRALEVINAYNLNKDFFEKLCYILGYDTKKQKMLPDGITALYSRTKIIEIFKENLEQFDVYTTTNHIEEIFDKVSEIFYKNIDKYTKPIPEAIDFIMNLHASGVKLGIVTSDSIVSTNMTLNQFGWDKYFDVVIGRESSDYTKESGEPTKLAINILNAPPKRTIMIGDTPTDSISAKNAGINKTILVATGQINKNTLKKSSAFSVNNLSEIQIDIL